MDEISNRNEATSNDNEEVLSSQNVVIEGQAKIVFSGAQDVFYNPVQEFNRDLSIAVLRVFSLNHHLKAQSSEVVGETYLKPGEIYENGITILEALGASGLRSIRYAKEIGGIKKIITNDLSSKAVESIQKNSQLNSVEHLITPSEGDASIIMYQHRHKLSFNCVDIDPYGSPSPFIDAGVQSVADGGILMVTATDMAILCGNEPETCYSKYACVSLKNKACHEMALRILLTNLSTAAARYGRYIHPLLSVSVDFYVRIFVLVFTSKKDCKSTASKLSMAYQCVQCHTISWQPLMNTVETNHGSRNVRAHGPPTSSECEFCHGRLLLGGPFYSQPIHDLDFVQSILYSLDNPENGALKTEKRIRGILSVIEEELLDVPFYHVLDHLASLVKLSVPSLVDFRSAILNAGYRVSFSHAHPLSIKTDAPPSVIWDLLQGFAKKQFPNKTWPRPLPDKPLAIDYLLGRSAVVEADFTLHPDANPNSRKQNLLRFQTNPEKNWGPKARAKSGGSDKARKVSSRKKRRIETQSKSEDNELL